MKINFKSFVCGIIAATTLFAVSAIARDVYENISVVRNSIELTVDGMPFEHDNFVYEGTTYVPIRAVAESLGFGVEYDDESYSANIVRDCSFKFEGETIGVINGYEVTDAMYDAYKNHVMAKQPELKDEKLDEAVKAEIKNNVYIIQIATALDYYIDSNFNNNYLNLVKFMEMQYGSAEAFVKEMRSQGFSDEMYRHIQEVSQLKSNILNDSELEGISDEDKDKLLEELIKELDAESEVIWDK